MNDNINLQFNIRNCCGCCGDWSEYAEQNIPEESTECDHEHDYEEACGDCGTNDNNLPSFLNVTKTFDNSKLRGVVYTLDSVLNGTVQLETDKIIAENELINELISQNAEKTQIFAKHIAFEQYTAPAPESAYFVSSDAVTATRSSNGVNVASKTNIGKLLQNLQYSTNYNQSIQKELLEGAIRKLADWLDDYINNYETKVSDGKNRGDSEVKLSFLLRLRKAIENSDFPIGFGNDEYFESESSDESFVMGAYSNSYYVGQYLNLNDTADDNNGVTNHLDRSIILNAKLFLPNRKYKTESALISAINNGRFDYLSDADVTDEDINQAYADILMSSDEVYYNYTETFLASVLAHELIHSTHVTNEAVTYNTCELIEDDFRNQVIFSGWKQTTQDAVDQIFSNVNLNEITYADAFLPLGGGSGIQFHDLLAYDRTLAGMENVVEHGHSENMEYENYSSHANGNTENDDLLELLNFVV